MNNISQKVDDNFKHKTVTHKIYKKQMKVKLQKIDDFSENPKIDICLQVN